MKKYLSKRLKRLPVSATLAMAQKARKLKEKGKDIISLSLGEPDFDVPEFIKQSAIEAINQNYNSYTPVDGYQELREAVCLKLKRDNNLTYEPDNIVVSTGAKQAIANVMLALLSSGDEVLLPCPYWVSYSAISDLCGAKFIEIPSSVDNDFKITPEQLEEAITPKTKMILFNSPNNPSGSVYSEEEFRALAEVLEKYPNVFVISDEIYEHIIYEGKMFSFASIESMYDRTIIINGLSKSFAMTGWRLGYLAAPKWIAKACKKLQGQVTSGTNCITQRAGITALETDPKEIQYMVDEFKSRRDLMMELLSEIEGFKLRCPKGAFYMFPDVSWYFGKTIKGHLIENATDFSMYLLEQAGVATVSGDAFGQKNCIRISFASSENTLREAVKGIKNNLG